VRSLSRRWKSWIDARAAYPALRLPVTLVDGEEDGSRQEERAANAQAIPTARSLLLRGASHFSSLETAAARRAHHSRGGVARWTRLRSFDEGVSQAGTSALMRTGSPRCERALTWAGK
jgi:hypothetical protein